MVIAEVQFAVHVNRNWPVRRRPVKGHLDLELVYFIVKLKFYSMYCAPLISTHWTAFWVPSNLGVMFVWFWIGF